MEENSGDFGDIVIETTQNQTCSEKIFIKTLKGPLKAKESREGIEKQTRKTQDMQKTKSKMADIIPNISIAFSMNGLNQRSVRLDERTGINDMLPERDQFRPKYT